MFSVGWVLQQNAMVGWAHKFGAVGGDGFPAMGEVVLIRQSI